MNFSEKPSLEELRREQENHTHLHNRYHARFLVSTIAMILVGIVLFLNQGKTTGSSEPEQYDPEMTETLTNIEDRAFSIAKKYSGAKIIAEKPFDNDIISVFEVGDQHSFCVFVSTENGLRQEYCGNLFPKADLVKGTVLLHDNTREYDIYLLGSEEYDSLLITRENSTQPKTVQQEKIFFDDAGIAVMQLDPNVIDPYPEIIAYDAEKNASVLTNGKLPFNKV